MQGYEIKNGPHDAPYLFTGAQILYDTADALGPYYVLDHDFLGCIGLPFSKNVTPSSGEVLLNGEKIPYLVKKLRIMADIEACMLGVRLTGRILEGDAPATLTISGFTDDDGNTMVPAEYTVIAEPLEEPLPQYAAHEAVALQAAEEGIVLLKNDDHALPFRNPVLNVVGEGLFAFQTGAAGAGKIHPRYQVDFRQAVHQDQTFRLNPELEAFCRFHPQEVPEEGMFRRAAEQSDTVIVILSRPSGENMDNSTAPGEYTLSDAEEALLAAVQTHFAKVVLVLNTGYPIAMKFTDSLRVSAMVYCGFGGMLAGSALLNVLTGRTTPSGRLTDSWVKAYDELPAANNFYDCYQNAMQRYTDRGPDLTTRYEEGLMVGYRYHTSTGKDALYPFGWGLSYTIFEETVQSVQFDPEKGASVSVRVKNTGSVPGKQVVQLYLHRPDAETARELIAFDKTETLRPGQAETLTLLADVRNMDVFCPEKQAYILPGGSYTLFLGENAQQVQEIGSFRLLETKIIRKTSVHLTGKRTTPGYSAAPLHPAVTRLAVKDMIRLCVCAGDGWGYEGTGEAGRVAHIGALPMPDYIVTDGNSGVNMKKRNIGMPSGACFASSFHLELVESVGRVIGEEAREQGVQMILAPGFNLHRHPLCGRNPEYFSEDPYLSGSMAAAYARGMESAGTHACYKHLVANNAESSRKRNDSVMDEATLRNLYLRSFEIALRLYQPAALMTAYNRLNGCPAANDPELVLGVARQEWGFRGFVMTDWCSYDTADVAQMVNAGISWITPGGSDSRITGQLEEAARNGTLDIRRLKENVSYLLNIIMK